MTFLYDLITSKISVISYQIPHAIKMTTFAFIFKGKLYTTEILCTRRFIKYICSLCATDPRSSAMVMKMIEFVHDHGPR
jgi:hypothetical protein